MNWLRRKPNGHNKPDRILWKGEHHGWHSTTFEGLLESRHTSATRTQHASTRRHGERPTETRPANNPCAGRTLSAVQSIRRKVPTTPKARAVLNWEQDRSPYGHGGAVSVIGMLRQLRDHLDAGGLVSVGGGGEVENCRDPRDYSAGYDEPPFAALLCCK